MMRKWPHQSMCPSKKLLHLKQCSYTYAKKLLYWNYILEDRQLWSQVPLLSLLPSLNTLLLFFMTKSKSKIASPSLLFGETSLKLELPPRSLLDSVLPDQIVPTFKPGAEDKAVSAWKCNGSHQVTEYVSEIDLMIMRKREERSRLHRCSAPAS